MHQLLNDDGFNGTFSGVRIKSSAASRCVAIADAIDSNDAAWPAACVPS
ncbi:hypothetical protein ALP11_101517 [Pseudomonas syringae pv. papulans]|nr:hypothetical protein ALP11_101517 [Pseudomonas syringae pv. papulans]